MGPGIGVRVAVPAAAPEHRAGVHARAAADAVERAPELLVGEQAAAPVVHDDDVQLAAAHRAEEVGRVGRDRLAGGAAREEPQEHRQVGEARDDLLDAHAGDVDGRERGAHVGVALVRAHDDVAGLGDGEVHAGEARPVPPGTSRAGGRARPRSGPWDRRAPARSRASRGRARRSPPSCGGSPGARCARAAPSASWTIRSPRSVSTTSMPRASRYGFRWHSSVSIDFDFTSRVDAALLEDAVDDRVVLLRVAGPVDPGAGRHGVPLELLEVVGEPRQRVRLDRATRARAAAPSPGRPRRPCRASPARTTAPGRASAPARRPRRTRRPARRDPRSWASPPRGSRRRAGTAPAGPRAARGRPCA